MGLQELIPILNRLNNSLSSGFLEYRVILGQLQLFTGNLRLGI